MLYQYESKIIKTKDTKFMELFSDLFCQLFKTNTINELNKNLKVIAKKILLIDGKKYNNKIV